MNIKLTPLDKLFSQYVRMRAFKSVHGCEKCGRQVEDYKQLQCSHFHSRRKKSVRWNPENAAGLCFTCHQFVGGNPLEHCEWFLKRLGKKRFEALNKQANMLVKPDVEAITLDLKQRIKELV